MSELRLYNSANRRIEPLAPDGPETLVYACGITPYDTTHLGHLFTYAAADVLVRTLELSGQRVRYVQNVTDIDDPIFRRSGETGEDWRELGQRWALRFVEDMQRLNMRPPDAYPKASDVLEPMQRVIARLIEAGVAYVADGGVYFAVDAWPEWGALSRIPRAEMLATANQRGNRPDDPRKRDPLDFVLWQPAEPGLPAWPSPWGEGRPGWHIECSTLVEELLGPSIDVHLGGADLVFPHHEAEIAQSEVATGVRPFARCWVHTGLVHLEGRKMSKSTGNLIMVRDLFDEYSPDALRLAMAMQRYREPWDYDEEQLEDAAALAFVFADAAAQPAADGPELDIEKYRAAFVAALSDDLDTPVAVAALMEHARAILEHGGDTREAQAELRRLAGVLGMRLGAGPDQRVAEGWRRHAEQFRD